MKTQLLTHTFSLADNTVYISWLSLVWVGVFVCCCGYFCVSHTSVLVWFCPCALGLLCPSTSLPIVTLSMSRESMLDAEAQAEFTLDRWDGASCSLTAPTEPVLRCCPPPDDPDEGLRSVAEEEDEEEEEKEEEEVWRAASSMLREAFSSWEVMSAREMLEAAGRVLLLPLLPRTVLAGDARVLLLALPVGSRFKNQLRWRTN